MATIYIYPGAPNTGVDFSAPNAAAYAALAGGGASNTVVFSGGYTYTPGGGKWWGRDQRYGMDKRIRAVINDGRPVYLTGLVYVTAAMSAVYEAAGTPAGVWTVDVITNSAAVPPARNDTGYFGARYDNAASGVELGWRYGQAASVADVGAEGLTIAGQRAGKGIWYMAKVGNTIKLYVWSPAGAGVRPEVQWGGIALMVRAGGGGQTGFCPLHGAFVFAGSVGNDPSGSSVEGDFRLVGAHNGLVGTPTGDYSTAYSSVSSITYAGTKMYGGRTAINLASQTVGTVIDGVKLTDGWLYDDRIDPAIYPALTWNEGEFEAFSIEYRVRNTVAENGTMICGVSHGLLSWVAQTYGAGAGFDASGAEESRSADNTARRLRLIARSAAETDIRAFAFRKQYRTTLQQCELIGFSTASKVNGKDTCILLNEFIGCNKHDTVTGGDSNTLVTQTLFTGSSNGGDATDDADNANISCKLLSNFFDRRGDAGRGVTGGYSGVEMRAYAGFTTPAGAMEARGNTFLGDAGQVGMRVKTHGSGAVNPNQIWVGNRYNQGETSVAPEGTSTVGTVQAASTTFSTGTVSGNIYDTAANILARGDLPARALAIGVVEAILRLNLNTSWISDLNGQHDMVSSQGVVPAGCADHVGETNSFNVNTQYGGSSVVAFSLGTAYSGPDGTLDADSLTRDGYETIRLIDDPDDPARKCYELNLDPTATGWTYNDKIRAQLAMSGASRRVRAWGTRTWFVTAFRVPASMKAQAVPAASRGWVVLASFHTTVDDYGGGGMLSIELVPGGESPENASLICKLNSWDAPNWPSASGSGEGPVTTLDLFAGGSGDEVPEDQWIYIALDYSMWHGYADPSAIPVSTPSGPFYVRPHVAVGNSSSVAKTSYSGTWGYPYVAESVGWAEPMYPVVSLYTNPASTWTVPMQVMTLGMSEWLHSDIEETNPGRTITADDVIAAFRASRI